MTTKEDKEKALANMMKELRKSNETFSSYKFNQAFDYCMKIKDTKDENNRN